MVTEFPTILYKDEGPHQRKGGTFNYIGVTNQKDCDELLRDGWFATLEEAISVKKDKPKTLLSREELEKKAVDLNIKFDGRTSDEKLKRLIDSI
ncbi:hypothetical protein UFOVP352_4 [uncultured Caudovirales phage]|uniref:Uncharacterized protein n=1 Tax=uncultured Caudovirales phage TaxID=2100421 RepID=A0A6J5M0I5_9CAUD|nr:hypothetical protein UFOVP352_4 [uncultured Caudovirales phage]CAB4218207.1 hypothetical protein UFOVP1607_7 [uncultured Caudovirales phage]